MEAETNSGLSYPFLHSVIVRAQSVPKNMNNNDHSWDPREPQPGHSLGNDDTLARNNKTRRLRPGTVWRSEALPTEPWNRLQIAPDRHGVPPLGGKTGRIIQSLNNVAYPPVFSASSPFPRLRLFGSFLALATATFLAGAAEPSPSLEQSPKDAPRLEDSAFPACVQFSPVPSGKGWKGEKPPLAEDVQRETIDNLIGHGFSGLYYPISGLSAEQNKSVLNYAQSRGMKINYMTGGFEMFDRDHPPAISVYSPRYAEEVKKRVQSGLAPIKEIQRIYTVFPFQDEPFHAGPASFDFSEDAKAEFKKRYGYEMPPSLDSARGDSKKWLDLLNFQSATFRDGWRQVYKIVKEFDPRPKIVLTHDSHSTFGAGVLSNARVAVDDVYYWGGDFADVFIYDIYPYFMFDFRYGEFGKLPQPRISQTHYTISQLRNVTTAYNRELAFWVGTCNKAWFKDFMGPELNRQYWAERELAYTAIAQGANLLVTGIDVPEDARHWEDFGQAMRVVQKAGPGLLDALKVKARAAFVFPRTQYLQLQEEYFNVGVSFELFLRAFGELDIIHEDQIKDDQLDGRQVLVLCDVKLLPAEAARRIEAFVRRGGVVVADCVPQMDAYKKPMDILTKLFGVSQAGTDRIVQYGHWVPYTTQKPVLVFAPPPDQKAAEVKTDTVAGTAFGHARAFKVVSPRACEAKDDLVLLRGKSGQPALIRHQVGQGGAYLFGFCLQDTYFQMWKENDAAAREQLRGLISDVLQDAKVRSHVYSSNPDIEAAVRANSKEGYVFIINHEAAEPKTTVRLSDLQFRVGQITDIESGNSIAFEANGDTVQFPITTSIGATQLLRVSPAAR